MTITAYASYDAVGLAALIRQGQVSRHEVAQAALQAIETLNPALNALAEVYPERGNTFSDQHRGKDEPFGGVPFLLKDLGAAEAGKHQEMGSRLTKGFQPDHDSELVKRYKAAGLLILGRTTTSEFGGSTDTSSVAGGITRNPWNPAYTPGGSSGGAAAAVASGMVPMAHATDLAGSIRIPAAFTGLVGLKPSRNLNPVGPDMGQFFFGLAVQHVLTRSVRDAAAALDATAGPAAGEFYYTPPQFSYTAALTHPPTKLKIALNLEPWLSAPLHPAVVNATLAAAQLCSSLGHEVEEQRFALEEAALLDCMNTIWAAYTTYGVTQLSAAMQQPVSTDTLERFTLSGYEAGKKLSARDLIRVVEYTNTVARAAGRFYENYDVMITPTTAITAPLAGSVDGHAAGIRWADWVREACAAAPFGQVFNIAGVPAISLPMGFDEHGIPVGVTFSSRMGNDALLLQLAAQLEKAAPWSGRTPLLYAGRQS
ncbi:amidase [Chitinophaga arvensicola]|uniref:Amidase n=1 Tax=Chitinophaga arvensicola TaxID=29529 RepID=A0A1I0RET9_9BACT|nr:amidase [Chitinophaga arvensicola]SEW39383.1 amidase [Chitinophaga arvensicola]